MKIKEIITKYSQTHWLFAFIALVFGIIFVFITPPLWGADEGVYFIRSYHINTGNFSQDGVKIGDKISYGGGIPQSFSDLNKLKGEDITDDKPTDTKQVDGNYAIVGSIPIKHDKVSINPYGPLAYHNVVFTAPVIGMSIASLFQPSALSLLYSARIATLLMYILLVFMAIYMIKKSSIRWMIFVIALLPMSIYQASVISADPLLIALSLIFFSSLYYIFHTKNIIRKRDIAIITFSALFMVLVKPPYLFIPLLLVCLPIKINASNLVNSFIRFGVPALCILVAFPGILGTGHVISASPLILPNVSVLGQLHWIILHPIGYLYMLINSVLILNWVPQVIGIFGSSFIFIAGPIMQVLLIALSLTALIKLKDDVYSEKNDTKLIGLTYLFFSLVACVAVITTLYLIWTPVGGRLVEGVQGRYFLSMVAFILIGFRMLTKSRLTISEKSAKIGYFLLSTLTLFASVLWYYKILY